MKRIIWKNKIVIDPEIHHGTPCIKGTRIPVSIIINSFADGMTLDQIQREYPQLKKEDVFASLSYAADVVQHELIY